MTTQFPLSGPLTVGGLLGRVFRLYRARFGLFLLTAAVLLLPIGIFPAVLVMFEEGSSFPLLVPGVFYLSSTPVPVLILLAAVLMFAVVYILAALVLTIQSHALLHGRPPAARVVLRQGLGRLLPYAATTATKWAAVIVAIVAAVYFAFFGVYFIGASLDPVTYPIVANPERYSSLAHAVVDVLNLFTFALPTVLFGALPVFLLARLFVAPAALVVDGSGPLDSLQRSWELSQGHSWRMMGYVMLLFLLLRLFNYAPATLFQFAIPRSSARVRPGPADRHRHRHPHRDVHAQRARRHLFDCAAVLRLAHTPRRIQ